MVVSVKTALLLLASSAVFPSLTQAQVRVLYQNDLSGNSEASSALLVYPDSSSTTKDPTALCGGYNEQLLSDADATSETGGVKDQLNYLVFRGDLKSGSQVFIADSSSSSSSAKERRTLRYERNNAGGKKCKALTVGTCDVKEVPCWQHLPALCTNSAPPYTVSNSSPSSGSHVSTTSKPEKFSVTGYRDARSLRFLGLPFAEPPVKSLRFQAAQPLKAAAKVYSNLSALDFGKPCLQNPSPFGVADSSTTDEDCLTLNVFTPVVPGKDNKNKGRLLPVAFWIYGGAFEEGAGSLPDYDGGNMASRGDVVVVTMNYRLGILGNMASESLAGSQGITDQIQALKWVKEYICHFGGDASKVTIFGQSAGGQSVVSLISSSAAKGLFHAAIPQSAPWNGLFTRKVYTDAIYPALLESTNCKGTKKYSSELECLQNVDSRAFLSKTVFGAIGAVSPGGAVEPLLPVTDTGVIDGVFSDLVQSGKVPNAHIPLMIGNVRDEGPLFVDPNPGFTEIIPNTPQNLQTYLPAVAGNATAKAILNNADLFPVNQSNPDALRTLFGEIVTLSTWQCPLQEILTNAYNKKTFSSIYSYRMDKGIPQNDGLPPACGKDAPSGVQAICHSEDIPEVFGNSDVRGIPYDGSYNSLEYVQYVMDTWTSFIRTYDPQPNAAYHKARGQAYQSSLKLAAQTPWKPFIPSSDSAIQLLDLPPKNSGVVYAQQCKVLDSVAA